MASQISILLDEGICSQSLIKRSACGLCKPIVDFRGIHVANRLVPSRLGASFVGHRVVDVIRGLFKSGENDGTFLQDDRSLKYHGILPWSKALIYFRWEFLHDFTRGEAA